jgi:hypothetical protein
VISLKAWLRRPVRPGLAEAKAQLEQSKSEQVQSHRLAVEVARLHQENRITARVHQAFRGGRA